MTSFFFSTGIQETYGFLTYMPSQKYVFIFLYTWPCQQFKIKSIKTHLQCKFNVKEPNPIIMKIGEGMGPDRLTPDTYQMRFLCIENIIHLYIFIYLNLLEIILNSKSSLSWDLFHFLFCCSGIIFFKYNHNISLHICTIAYILLLLSFLEK